MSHFNVRSTSDDGRVVLWERNPAHPGGEVFVAGTQPVPAGMTGRVQALLQEGRLELVEPEADSSTDEDPPTGEEQEAGSTSDEEAVNDVPPIVDPSAPPATDAENELIRIDGISEVRLKALQQLGVNSYADLLAGDSEALAQALPRVNVAMVDDWKQQAQALASGA